ncbi:tyrosine-type recombinase/integrase [Desulfobacter vibrioformis]|uniref:tyrosine-type recombinase/integrase n=1 Tax=Desulfobacter vibrioformis TaxID=34031 RepID=UPI000553C6B3|nr:site-specific integrase [Desulfobacter vibrioformis]
MPKQIRTKTKYAGVFYVEGTSAQGKPEKVYYIRYRKSGKMVEEKAGRQYQDDMTPARASGIRAQKIDGEKETNQEKRDAELAKKAAEAGRYTINRLWKEYSLQKKKNLNYTKDNNRYEQHIKKKFGDKEPDEIIALDVERHKRELLKKYSPQTVKHVLALLKRIANYGFELGLSKNLQFKVKMPKVDNIKDDSLSPEELARLYDAIQQDSHPLAGNIMLMALYTGMRRGELFKLKWSDIDFEKGFISILEPKGGKDQIIPLNDMARSVLEKVVRTDSDYVFPGRNGGQLSSISGPVNKIKAAANLPKETRPIHSLRHTFATMAVNSDKIDLYILQKLTTHKTPQLLQRYAHLNDTVLKKGSEDAGNAVAEHLQKQDDARIVNLHVDK